MTSANPNRSPGSEPGSPVYWRSFGELENSPEFREIVEREFPAGITDAPDAVSRLGFLTAIAASVALAGLTSCRKPKTAIVPLNKRPEGFLPGVPRYYATSLSRGGYGVGALVKSSEGRPTKVDGNPEHPSSLGGSDLRLQAELLQLYDPARSRRPRGNYEGAEDDPDGWFTFLDMWNAKRSEDVAKQGEGVHFLLPPTSSPSLQGLIAKTKSGGLKKAQFHFWSPTHDDNARAGSLMAFGRAVTTSCDFGKADVVVSLDCDFLGTEGNNLRAAREWASTRRAPVKGKNLSRLYVIESVYSDTGVAADHRFRMRASDVPAVAFALANALGVGGGTELSVELGRHGDAGYTAKNGANWLQAIVEDLRRARGRCVVTAGKRQTPAVHAVVHAINHALGNVGQTVTYREVPEGLQHDNVASLQALRSALDAGSVDTLVCIGVNPALDAPAEFGFAELIGKAGLSIHVGDYDDETGRLCHWHFPLAHELEAWGDVRAHDGTIGLQQPLIEPLHGGVSPIEFLAFLAQEPNYDGLLPYARDTLYGHDLVKAYWREASGASDFDAWWQRALHDGVVAGSAFAAETPTLTETAIAGGVRAHSPVSDIEIVLRPCPKMGGGRYANNSWMQEIPDPLTKLSWDNAALVSMATAARLGVENGDVIAIAANDATVEIPAWILPGLPDDSITIHLGWGRDLPADCKVSRGAGFNAYPLRGATSQWVVDGAQVTRTGGRRPLVCTQEHGTMAGRAIVREADAATNERDPRWAPKMSPLDQAAALKHEGGQEKDINKSLWEERGYELGARSQDDDVKKSPYQWGMVIDLNACTGCSACLAGCVAENNIPMVGRIQVSRNREMFWIRNDRYFTSQEGDNLAMAEDPQVSSMPVPCMQCENAPCEAVCPVAATTHSPDGLNDMAYNRCVGTRYCSNNCPYKVRRYNYLDYLGEVPDTKRMAFNPDVTVRTRGVMEKCTYCVQRINAARIDAKLQDTKVGDGEGDVRVTTACAQACPTQAITFGNIIEEGSEVSKLRATDLNYGVLSDLNTKPRTTYLGRVRNPNPELV